MEEFDKGENMDILRQRFETGIQAGDHSRILVWSGTGVGLMREIKPAKVNPNHMAHVSAMILSN